MDYIRKGCLFVTAPPALGPNLIYFGSPAYLTVLADLCYKMSHLFIY